MSADACCACGTVVPTTYSPNDVEGYFLSQARIETALEPALDAGALRDATLYAIFRRIGAVRVVLCLACQARAQAPEGPHA